MKLYLEMLAQSMLDKDFLKRCQTHPYENDNPSYAMASRNIENRISTCRESLLGSGAWRQEFMSELQFRPFYQVTQSNIPEEKCSVCNRSAQSAYFTIHLFGTSYEAKKMYETSRWDKILPVGFFTDNL